ncbi:MAG: hypothetical protein HN356_15755 [Calditrichaeota bacterium]|nr:hypothetical protein [Calditrichota bacterium]MBT7616758.1 hypothetical protein [Calditrichota bacterium]MBT7789068.1 hypothetical protein [Calditrichota bacterium]
MFRYLILFLFVIISGCGTSDNPTETTEIPDNIRMTVITEPDTVASGLDDVFSTVTITLTDVSDAPLPAGLPVHLSANLGLIQPTATTNESGQAIVRYTPPPEPGVAQINATYEGVHGPVERGGSVCIVDPRNPVGFLVSADPREISVAGSGRNTTSVISVLVVNGIGEPVTAEVEVGFELIQDPNMELGHFNGYQRNESVETINGIACVGFNAHTRPYIPIIQIATADLDNNILSCRTSPLVVVSGSPFQEEIEICNVGIDAGGGDWKIEVSARVWDLHRNPVADGIPAVFTCEPEIATIGTGYTGNKNRKGESIPGVAFAELVYHSVNTFDPIEISCDFQTDRGLIMNSREAILPLQDGRLDFNIDPGNWHFGQGDDPTFIKCWVVLTDGHGTLINNAPILFTTSKSRFYWSNFIRGTYEPFYPEPAIKYTSVPDPGRNDIEYGRATVYLMGEEQEFFFDPFELRTEVELEAKVLGYESETKKTRALVVTRWN